jgi:hypothetical protein
MQRFLQLLAVATLALCYGCKDCAPIPATIYQAKLLVYDYDSIVQNRLVLFSDTLSALTGEGLPNPLYTDRQVSETALDLPLSNQSASVSFSFVWKNNSAPANMVLGYKRTAMPVPPDCGIYEVYEGLEAIEHSFDSVAIIKPDLEFGDALHVRAFIGKK